MHLNTAESCLKAAWHRECQPARKSGALMNMLLTIVWELFFITVAAADVRLKQTSKKKRYWLLTTKEPSSKRPSNSHLATTAATTTKKS